MCQTLNGLLSNLWVFWPISKEFIHSFVIQTLFVRGFLVWERKEQGFWGLVRMGFG